MSDILLRDGLIFDGVSPELVRADVLVSAGTIKEISATPLRVNNARVINIAGRTLMPGLIDAHVHVYFPDVDTGKTDRMPMSLVAHHARLMLEGCATRGFTTVRDCGGADYGLALAIEREWIRGPRVIYCGKALSQTGGHSDKRNPFETEYCACAHAKAHGYEGHRTRVVDGPDNLRLAVREELRRGAGFIKIMASGGVASPSDPIHLAQYSDDEICAVVDEVERHEVYVTAHAHPDEAIKRAIKLGVHCIEHGTLISAETARLAASEGVPVVPTLAVVKALTEHGAGLGFPRAALDKLAQLEPVAVGALERLKSENVQIGFGTDLIGGLHIHQCLEFSIRREVFSPFEILRSATSVNAAILRQDKKLGRVSEGYVADLIVVDGDPLRDLSLFTGDGRFVPMVMKGGALQKMRDL